MFDSNQPVLLGFGIHRKNNKPFNLKLVHIIPGEPAGIENMPEEWELTQSKTGYTISWLDETLTESKLKLIGLSPNDPPGEYELMVYIEGALSKTLFIQYAHSLVFKVRIRSRPCENYFLFF